MQRGKTKSYKIIPVTENDTIIDKKYILTSDKDLERAITADKLIEQLTPRIEKLFKK